MHLRTLVLEKQIHSAVRKLCGYLRGFCQMKSPSLQIKLVKEQQAVSLVMSWLGIWHGLIDIWETLFWWFDITHLSGSLSPPWVGPSTPLLKPFWPGRDTPPPDKYFILYHFWSFVISFFSALALFHNFAGKAKWGCLSSTAQAGHHSHTEPAQICFRTVLLKWGS